MNKGGKVLRLLGILFLSVSLSLQVFAAETDDEEVFFENGNTDEILFEDLQNEYPIVSESDFEDLGLSFPGIVHPDKPHTIPTKIKALYILFFKLQNLILSSV